MLGKEEDYISIAINEDSIKLAHFVVSDTHKKLTNVGKRSIAGVSDDELPKVISSVLSEMNVNSRKTKAVLVIPSDLTTTKNIEIPSRDAAEIRSIINLQAGRHTPYSREEILISYINIGVYQTNYTKVLLVISNRNVVKKQITSLEKAGLKVEKVLFVPEGIATFYSKALELQKEEIPVGIIDISNRSTDFSIEFKGTVITCRNIPIGIKQITAQGQEARDKLIAEISKSIEVYQSEDIDKVPATFILSSDDVVLKEIQPLLREKLKSTLKVVPYLDHVESTQASLLKIIQDFNDDSFLDVIAPMSALESSQVELMPEEMKIQQSIDEQTKHIVKAGILASMLFILLCVFLFNKLYFKSALLSKLDGDYKKIRGEVDVLEDVADRSHTVHTYLNDRMVSLDVLKEIYRVIPVEIYLENVEMDDKGTISIRGTSDSMSLVFSLVTSLEDSGLFKSVKTKSTAAKKERGKDVAAFEIGFKLESARDDEEPAKTAADGKQEKKTETKS